MQVMFIAHKNQVLKS